MPNTGMPTEERGGVPSLRAIVALIAGSAGLFLLGGLPLQLLFGEAGLVMAQLAFLLTPALLLVVIGGLDVGRTLRPVLPHARQVAGGVILLAGGTLIAWFLAWLQSFVIPVPVEYLEAMAAALTPDSVLRWAWLLIVVAAVPALAEEVLFRGVVLAGLRDALPTLWAIVAVGLIFGLFHLTPQTAFRFLPTAWMGILLAWVVVVTGSLPLAILLHFLNNGAILTLTALPQATGVVGGAEEAPTPWLLPVALALLIWGGSLLRPAPPSVLSDRQSKDLDHA